MAINFSLLWASGLSLTIVLLIAKYAVIQGVHPLHFAFFQALGGFLFIAFYHFNLRDRSNQGETWSVVWRYKYYFIISALLGIALPQILAFYAVAEVGVGIVSLSYCLPLVVSYFISLGFKLEQYEPQKMAFLFLTVFGTFIYLFKPEYLIAGAGFNIWYLLLLLIPLSVGSANIYRTLKWPTELSVTAIAMWINFSAALLLALLIWLFVPQVNYLFSIPIELFGLILIQMIFSGTSQILAFVLQKRAGPVFISQTGSVVTVTGGFFGYLVFSEQYSINSILGSACVFIGVYLYSKRKFEYRPNVVKAD